MYKFYAKTFFCREMITIFMTACLSDNFCKIRNQLQKDRSALKSSYMTLQYQHFYHLKKTFSLENRIFTCTQESIDMQNLLLQISIFTRDCQGKP